MTSNTDMIPGEVSAHIAARLEEVEKTDGVRILFAVESGSRAWGFPSPDSDYDVRFVYAHPLEWYLQIDEGRDVIERGIDEHLVDLAGWDIRKALRLLRKSNAALYEWTRSPIIYRDEGTARSMIQSLFEASANRKSLCHHYSHTADGQWRRAIAGREQVKLKKYFYVVRPLLAFTWAKRLGTPPPMNIDDLLLEVPLPPEVDAAFQDVLSRKAVTDETGLSQRVPGLDAWIEQQLDQATASLAEMQSDNSGAHQTDALERANALFRAVVRSEI
ncbi:MAG: nucleotidyltransferase domain-containing protein [Filomicrobium sp.]